LAELKYFIYFVFQSTFNVVIMKLQAKRLIIIGLIILILLSIPLIAMQFTTEVNWDLSDFLIMGAALFGIALVYELITWKSDKKLFRAAVGVALLGAFLLFWVNGAVGIIGNEGQPANLLFGAVFVVGLVGALISKFRSKGLSNTMFAAAAIQMLVPVVALVIWPPSEISWSPGLPGVFLLTGFFALLFLVSGLLFRKASMS